MVPFSNTKTPGLDLTTLKTIVRSNPGVLVLEKGTIVQKLHYNDLENLIFE